MRKNTTRKSTAREVKEKRHSKRRYRCAWLLCGIAVHIWKNKKFWFDFEHNFGKRKAGDLIKLRKSYYWQELFGTRYPQCAIWLFTHCFLQIEQMPEKGKGLISLVMSFLRPLLFFEAWVLNLVPESECLSQNGKLWSGLQKQCGWRWGKWGNLEMCE